MRNNTYVYRHIRLDNNQVFYIGIGTSKNYRRAYDKIKRNLFWKKVINKTDYIVEIIAENLTKETACELEEFLIKIYGRKNLKTGSLVNLTDGGELNTGKIVSKETRLKMSISRKNRTYYRHTEEFKIKYSEFLKGNTYNAKKIINLDTLEIYNSIKEVAKKYNKHPESIGRMLRGIRGNTLNLMYYKDYKKEVKVNNLY